MTWWQAILLGALQGITEFLPISSSGHLVLAQHYLGFGGETGAHGAAALFFDGVLHLGTLVAVLLYFRKGLLPTPSPEECAAPLSPGGRGVGGEGTPRANYVRLAILVTLASFPAGLMVLLRSKQIQESFEKPLPVAINFLVLGALLLVTDRWLRPGKTTFATMRWWHAVLIGCGQAVSAYFRGMSRSGTTISVALITGQERTWAVRFSFLMSIVASLGLGGLGIFKALRDPDVSTWLTPRFLALAALGTAVSAVVGYLSIAPLIALVRKACLWWFAIYLWLIGLLVLWDQLRQAP